MKRPPSAHARYQDRKARRVCVDCEAGLQDDDGIRCVECVERQAVGDARRVNRAGKRTPESAARLKVRQRAEYEQHKLTGVCVAPSCKEPALDDNVRCQRHRDLSRTASLNYWRRRRGAAEGAAC